MAADLPPIPFLGALVGAIPSRNDAADVLWVQGLLNRWLKAKGKPVLGLDGGCGQMTSAAIVEFQTAEVKLASPDGRIVPGGPTALRLLAQRPTAAGKITTGKSFVQADHGVTLDKQLLLRVLRLCQCLIDIGVVSGNVKLNQGVRAPATAHRWSTSWNIRKRHVSLAALKALKDGKDVDGNLWFDAAWEASLKKKPKDELDAAGLKSLWQKIDANAATYYASDAVAAEGYKQSDPRSKPNGHKSLSNHIDGNAMDVSIPWMKGATLFGKKISNGGNSEEAANRVVREFGLSRPVKSERWRFQLPANESKGFVGENNLSVGGPSTGEGPQDEN